MPRGRPRKNPIVDTMPEKVSIEFPVEISVDTHCHKCGWGEEYGAKLSLIERETLCQKCK